MDPLALAVIISAVDRATGPVQKVAASINRLTQGARSLSERMTAAGEKMTVVGAIAQAGSEKLLGFIEKPVEAASEMQESLARVAAVTGLAGQALEQATGYDATGRHVIFATRDYGETVDSALQRPRRAGSRVCRRPPSLHRLIARLCRSCPTPHLVLSNCIPLGIDDPTTTLGGYDSGGAGVPMTLAVGRRPMHLVVDHRVFNPLDEAALMWGADGSPKLAPRSQRPK